MIDIRFILLAILLLFNSSLHAYTLSEAKELYKDGRFEEAVEAFKSLYGDTQKNARNASLNHWLGVSLYKIGYIKEAKQYLEFAASKKVAEANYYLSRIAFENYNFEEAASYAEQYSGILNNSENSALNEIDQVLEYSKLAKSMIEHVEKIVIIDSIIVDKTDFFNSYKISSETGSFKSSENLSLDIKENPTTVFVSSNGDRMMWSDIDTTGVHVLKETFRLLDDSWDECVTVDKNLNNGGDAIYPFMMPDGMTLYYACNGEGSIGGYDIFMSRKNSEDGSFYQSQNVGMPYNSPYDDYLLVKDELTGLGWWATDRNQIPGKVTIYVFITNEIRENYSIDDPKLAEYAKINRIQDTWEEGADYTEHFNKIKNSAVLELPKSKKFDFEIKKGVIYTSLDDFKTSEGESYMQNYLETLFSIKEAEETLRTLREEFSGANQSEKTRLKSKILSLEKAVLKKKEELGKISNSVIKAEKRKLTQN